MRYELSDNEWRVVTPMLPNKSRGVARVLNGIFWVLRSGAPWRDLPESYGPHTTCYNCFVMVRSVWSPRRQAARAGIINTLAFLRIRFGLQPGLAHIIQAAIRALPVPSTLTIPRLIWTKAALLFLIGWRIRSYAGSSSRR